jgi:hypothetical protein
VRLGIIFPKLRGPTRTGAAWLPTGAAVFPGGVIIEQPEAYGLGVGRSAQPAFGERTISDVCCADRACRGAAASAGRNSASSPTVTGRRFASLKVSTSGFKACLKAQGWFLQ